MTIWDFAHSNPGTALLIVFIVAVTIVAPFHFAFEAYNRTLRARNIATHGWPTPPMDADGDVKYPDKDDDEDEDETTSREEFELRAEDAARCVARDGQCTDKVYIKLTTEIVKAMEWAQRQPPVED